MKTKFKLSTFGAALLLATSAYAGPPAQLDQNPEALRVPRFTKCVARNEHNQPFEAIRHDYHRAENEALEMCHHVSRHCRIEYCTPY